MACENTAEALGLADFGLANRERTPVKKSSTKSAQRRNELRGIAESARLKTAGVWRSAPQGASAANETIAGAASRWKGQKLGVENIPLYLVRFYLTPQETGSTIPPTSSPDARPPSGPSPKRGGTVQYMPGWTVQCINPECQARGIWLRADVVLDDCCSNCHAPMRNVPPPIGPRLRLRPRSLGSYRPASRPR